MNSHSLESWNSGGPPAPRRKPVPAASARDPADLKNDRRQFILRAAAKAFKKKGFLGTTMGDISRELGMTQGNLYHYFDDKEDILFQCHDYSLNLVLNHLDEINRRGLRPDEKLRHIIEFHVGVMIDELQASAMALEFHVLSGSRLRRIIAKRDKYERGLRRIVEDGVKTCIFRPLDVKQVTFSILGAINWIAKWYSPGGDSTAEQVAGTFTEVFLGGVMK